MKAIAITAAVLTGTLIISSLYFYNLAIARGPKEFLSRSPDLQRGTSGENSVSLERTFSPTTWLDSQNPARWEIQSDDGLKLVGLFIPASTPTNRTVICAHGYTSQSRHMAQFARFFHEKLGFNVLLPDARGHGESEGDYIGFGWHERKDYLLWIQRIIEEVGEDSQIVLFGISMGGATVMMVSGEDLPPQVKAIIEDCGYTSVDAQLSYQLSRMYHLPSFPLLNTTSLVTKLKAGYSFSEASALEQIKKNKLPILFIHGAEDWFVPVSMVYELYEACPSEKELYIVEGAGHGAAYGQNPEEYERRVADFLKKYLEETPKEGTA
ncbi:MAG: alpha/beta hydrolase [Firmicutes bacterium]|jgi:fermentation-respiration switch protein FrsA (DUF1100 family)|nr:alpha/beta hydrolase [Bacillota bacterium]HOL14014.1 alpha/beta hydrolase [Bacillota bacterium]